VVAALGAAAMCEPSSGRLAIEGAAALSLMEEALVLLDRCDDHAMEVGAHLDLAICRLRARMGAAAADRSESQ